MHFALVAVGALPAAFGSAGLTAVGVRRGDGRTVLLGARRPRVRPDQAPPDRRQAAAERARRLRRRGPPARPAPHERLDGGGYPDGIAGAEIDGATRILAVCDVYDALVSDRVYRRAWSSERALELLRSEAGSAFDGRCVHALARVLERTAAR